MFWLGYVFQTMVRIASSCRSCLQLVVDDDDDDDDCRTEQATTCAHCLNLVFIVFELSPRLNIACGLVIGEDISGSETAYEYVDMLGEDVDDDIEDDLDTVSKYC